MLIEMTKVGSSRPWPGLFNGRLVTASCLHVGLVGSLVVAALLLTVLPASAAPTPALYVADAHGVVHVFDGLDGALLESIELCAPDGCTIGDIAVTGKGAQLVAVVGGLEQDTFLAIARLAQPHSVDYVPICPGLCLTRRIAASSDGARVYIAIDRAEPLFGDVLMVVDVVTHQTRWTAIEGPWALATSQDGRTVYVTQPSSDTVSVFDSALTVSNTIALPLGTGARDIAISADGHNAYVPSVNRAEIEVIDLTTVQSSGSIPLRGVEIATSPTSAFANLAFRSTVHVIDLNTQTATRSISLASSIDSIMYSRDGTLAYALAQGSGKVYFFDSTSPSVIWATAGILDRPSSIAVGCSEPPCPDFLVGDCNHNDAVTVDELVTAVQVGLGTSYLDACRRADANLDGAVTVDEVVLSLRNALLRSNAESRQTGGGTRGA